MFENVEKSPYIRLMLVHYFALSPFNGFPFIESLAEMLAIADGRTKHQGFYREGCAQVGNPYSLFEIV